MLTTYSTVVRRLTMSYLCAQIEDVVCAQDRPCFGPQSGVKGSMLERIDCETSHTATRIFARPRLNASAGERAIPSRNKFGSRSIEPTSSGNIPLERSEKC